ncbi:hypothetical protein [Sulfurimonas sp.]
MLDTQDTFMESNMTREKIFKEIGHLKPSISTKNYKNVNFSSIFIVPIPHNFHDVRNIIDVFEDMQKNWIIKNNSIKKDLFLHDIKKYIKNFTFEKFDLNNKKDLKSVVYDKKNLYLSYKNKNMSFSYDEIYFILKEIDLWIMDGNIALFAYKVELDKNNIYDIDTLSKKMNRELRDFRSLTIDTKNNKLYYKNSNIGIPLLEYFISLTNNVQEGSFLNVLHNDNKFIVNSDLDVIEASTYYAKMITALHINEDSVYINNVPYTISKILDKLSEKATIDLGILEELSYILATTSSYDFKSELGFVAYEGYTYPIIQENGINIWKLWSGIALQDSVAFFSVSEGGSGIVFNAKTSNYFIYILNIYVSIRLKYIENYLIDKDFINIERVLPSVREIQILKNHYIASEIAVKFQHNYINDKINYGLKTNHMIEEVENNVQTTLELTKNNTDIVFSLGAGIATLSSMWLTSDSIIQIYNDYPYLTLLGVIILSILIVVAVSKKSMLIRRIKNGFKIVKRFVYSLIKFN